MGLEDQQGASGDSEVLQGLSMRRFNSWMHPRKSQQCPSRDWTNLTSVGGP